MGYYRPGDWFRSRLELSQAGLHRPTRAGISGTAAEGADSIVLSGAYEDDVFSDEEVVYTGHGGRDPKTGKQAADQVMTERNRALLRSLETGLPVRLLRKVPHPTDAEGTDVFRYEGLYTVVKTATDTGKSGFQVLKFWLRPLPGDQQL